MKQRIIPFVGLCALMTAVSLHAQNADSKSKTKFVEGPAKAQLERVGDLDVPAGYRFLDGKTTRALMKAGGEPVSGQEVGLLMPTNDDFSVMFEFNDSGYVKDEDKDKLDPDKLLSSIKRGNDEANKERRRNGIAPVEVVGWEIPPKYDETTHNLQWAIRGTSEGHPIVNYNTRLLGRKGVMEVVLIIEPDKLQSTLPTFNNILGGYSFQQGQTYAEYKPGDKVAKYGLAALVVGGAAVGAAKLGLLAWLAVFLKKGWKLIVVAFAAVATGIRKLFSKASGRAGTT